MRPRPFLVVALVGALLGFIFSSVSTYDFEQHLDRQVHSVHCSFVPGIGDEKGDSTDCETTLMSPYSSVYRSSIWGGIPISLPSMSVFAFLLFFGVDLLLGGRQRDKRATGFYVLATALPAMVSVIMAYISIVMLDAACKLCIGIYISSFIAVVGAFGLWFRSWGAADEFGGPLSDPAYGEDPAWASDEPGGELEDPSGPGGSTTEEDQIGDGPVSAPTFGAPEPDPVDNSPDGPISFGKLAGMFGLGILFVAFPVFAYVTQAPDHSQFIGKCGALDESPPEKLLFEMGPQDGTPALEVFDPLCPACKAFEDRLRSSGFRDDLARRAVMFPLDNECNWMLDQAVHPGACAVSEAVICADSRAGEVIDWAFANQKDIRKAAEESDGAARSMIKEKFPDIASCVGSPKVQSTLNQSLRWAVDNKIKLLTPQLYVDGVRLCDEDVDLGLEFALSTMIERQREGTLRESVEEETSGDEASGDEASGDDEEGGS